MPSKGIKLTDDGRVYRKGKRIYANKDIYEGEFVDGLKHGRGTLRYSNGNKYVGEFVNDLPEGFGLLIYAGVNEHGDRSARHRYEGSFKCGKKHGKGLYVSAKNDTYTGMFENDLYHGHGVLKTSAGDVYEGEWFKGRASGENNSVKYHTGDEYTGGMKAGYFHGNGEFKWRRNQGSYKGEWFKGKPQGRGVRIFVNGNRFTGSFYNGRINGDGVMSYANGDQYIGSWVEAHKHGKGVMRYASGDRYEGSFMHGFFYGQGKFIWSDGGYYEGEYVNRSMNPVSGISFPDPNGKRNGLGVRVWKGGNRYEGAWKDDNMHGSGVLQKTEGGKYRGEFWNGLRHGMGSEEFGNTNNVKYVCPMGVRHKGEGYCVYTGQFSIGYFDGVGEFVCQDGRTYSGEMRRGKRHGQGSQTYLRDGESGDPKRMFISGVGSLYRFKQYKGTWVEDVKEGEGEATYVNGDKLEGNFSNGRPHGILKYTFAATGKTTYATYVHGHRTEWASSTALKAKKLLNWLDDEATFHREFNGDY